MRLLALLLAALAVASAGHGFGRRANPVVEQRHRSAPLGRARRQRDDPDPRRRRPDPARHLPGFPDALFQVGTAGSCRLRGRRASRSTDSPSPTKRRSVGNGVRVRIGSADTDVDPGVHTYVIDYTTTGQLGFFDGYDELYWNVTGNGWVFPIDRATARVHLPRARRVRPGASRLYRPAGRHRTRCRGCRRRARDDNLPDHRPTRSLRRHDHCGPLAQGRG